MECLSKRVRIDKIVAVGSPARHHRHADLGDVTGRDIHVTDNDLAPAIGAAVFASVAAGLRPCKPPSGPVQRYRAGPSSDARHQGPFMMCYAKYLQVGRSKKMRRG